MSQNPAQLGLSSPEQLQPPQPCPQQNRLSHSHHPSLSASPTQPLHLTQGQQTLSTTTTSASPADLSVRSKPSFGWQNASPKSKFESLLPGGPHSNLFADQPIPTSALPSTPSQLSMGIPEASPSSTGHSYFPQGAQNQNPAFRQPSTSPLDTMYINLARPGSSQGPSNTQWGAGPSGNPAAISPTTTKRERAISTSSVGGRPTTANSQHDTIASSVKEEDEEPEEESKVDHRKRKRNRTIRSCVPCHNHKRKCDRKRPCGRCTALGLTGSCVYEVDEARDPNDPDVIETDRLRRRIAELEQVVRELRQRHPPRGSTGAAQAAAAAAATAQSDLDKRRVIVNRFARFKADEAAAAGSPGATPQQSGPGGSTMSLSDLSPESSNTGGRTHYAEPYVAHAEPGEELVSDQQGRKTFLGTPAGKPMFKRLREVIQDRGKPDAHADLPEELAFTGWFASPRKTFPFTTIWSHENFIDEIIGLLPTAEEAELLLTSFIEEICVIFHAFHLPTLTAEYRHFFSLSFADKRTQPLSHLAVFVMICSLGSMVRAAGSEIFGETATAQGHLPPTMGDKQDLTSSRLQSELYLSAAYQALRLCSFLSSPTLATIQAQILINIYLIHSERAADSWALTGSLVRQSIAMGLHVDPTNLDPTLSMRDAEVRRRIWWTVAGLDVLLCVSFGRPTVITYYTCGMPQDIDDNMLSEEPGSAMLMPTSNSLGPETGTETYHAAYFQLTVPSLDLLNRVFHVNQKAARATYMGWFKPNDPNVVPANDEPHGPGSLVGGNTYEDAIRLGRDIFEWYSQMPEGMRFDPDEVSLESLKKRSRTQINQTLALCVKTFILVLILHRPYLRADPSAYPESSNLCSKAAHIILAAYAAMVKTKASIAWSWWTMSYRAFHAGTVCAFLAIREPGTELAERCLADLRGAITIFENRTHNWNVSHPVQGDLCGGLVRLEKLATIATQQHPEHLQQDSSHTFPGLPNDLPAFPNVDGTDMLGLMHLGGGMHHSHGTGAITPVGGRSAGGTPSQTPGGAQAQFMQSWAGPSGQQPDLAAFTHPEALSLPQIWASMFNIKMEPETFGLPAHPPPPPNPPAGVSQGEQQ